jgi:uncharacterized SAM-binding protein YcdF (DUF218 family)
MHHLVFLKILKYLLSIFKTLLITLGSISLVMIILAFTSVPYRTRYWLGTHKSEFDFKPDYIIMLGGNGMPSEDNLIRLFYLADVANTYLSAKIIIAQPVELGVYQKMRYELISKNIDSSRIQFEKYGINTRSQALNIKKFFPATIDAKILIVTSTEHVLRSVLAFRKAGFKFVGGCPSFECDLNLNMPYDWNKLGGRKYIPNLDNNLSLRYSFWSYLRIEILCLREFTALGYYYMKNWIGS